MSDDTDTMGPDALRARVATLEAENSRLRAANDGLEYVREQLSATVATLTAQIQAAQVEVRSLQGDLVEVTEELASTRRALDDARAGASEVLRIVPMTRRDLYILAAMIAPHHYWPVDTIIGQADALLAAADRREP